MIAVIGRDWLGQQEGRGQVEDVDSNDYIFFELQAAMENNVPIVPVLVGNADIPEASRLHNEVFVEVSRLNAFRLTDLQWQRDLEVLTQSLRLSYQVPPSRVDRIRNMAFSFALTSAALLVISLLMGVVEPLEILRPIVFTLSLPALIGYLVLVAWMARFTGGSRMIVMSVLAGLAIHLKAFGASGLALFVVFGSVLLFRDIHDKNEKSKRRLVDRFDYLLEGTAFGAATGSVLILIPLQYVLPEGNVYTALGPGLILGAIAGLVIGLYRYRHRIRSQKPDERTNDEVENT